MVEEDIVEDRKKKIEEEQKKLDEEQKKALEVEPVVEEKGMDKIDKANEAAERLERTTKEYRIENDRREKLAINDKLGGRSEVVEKPTEAEKVKEGAKALLPEGMDCPGVTD